ncbi:type III-A CRISPR-associated RAMP protein Csm3 [candidate division WOR-3 bacterium JGI_Cruoil_03_44_89]|uniref:CRISPR system Cms endoribonuclease Csm3 n=1 Tax=candidate division WOR-3 bacterium JGI_Cruoil_03_44_89 TaxID=1973748 RepID=A0A235BQS0_UNCW3|nr:MAG: type III-A CRISPR-associated RAMP protein Csm3 [candidate division WOR-3 bacterium JGI_Cruoil_03_44_89]
MSYKFIANVIISGKIKCETGLHIGGMVEGYEIGGMDNPIIKDPVTGYPYIPGSSLRGKMRSLLEWAKGKVEVDKVHHCPDSDCPVCRSFGAPAEDERKIGPTRLIVRDACPTEETRESLDNLQKEKGLPKAEWKTENVINRITSAATPREIERVPKDSEFEFELVYGIYDVDGEKNNKDIKHLKYVFEALRLLEDSALGGSGSRGSGQIKIFLQGDPIVRKKENYENGQLEEPKGEYKPLSDFSVDNFIEAVRTTINNKKGADDK